MKDSAWILFVIAAALLLVASCGFEEAIFSAATDKGPDWVPDAPKPYKVKGQVYGLPGAAVDYYTPGGVLLDQFSASADGDGLFSSEFPGSTEYRNLVVKATAQPGSALVLGLALRIPRNPDIYFDQVASYHLAGMTAAAWPVNAPVANLPVFANLDDRSTTLTLILLAKAAIQEIGLTSVSIPSMNQALQTLADQYYGADTEVHAAGLMISRLLAAAAAHRHAPELFVFPTDGSLLNPAFLDAVSVDYSGDGHPDADTAAFDAVLAAVAEAVTLSACEGTGKIKVVFMADMRPGSLDRNCNTINRFKVAKDEAGRRMYITGGMFTNPPTSATPACGDGVTEHCLTADEWAGVNDMLGAWAPNQVPMRDDGQAGDATAGDGIWTLVLEVPYISVTGLPGSRGVRIGYKFTWGFPGDGWGGTEEWSGNNRILELNDRNGDGIIVRYDYFGDETSNKFVANIFKGPCNGTAPWPEDVPAGCEADIWENRIDLDGDCTPDAYPSAGTVAPSCKESDLPSPAQYAAAFIGGEGAVTLAGMTPGAGVNGGGFLVTVNGTGLRAGLSMAVTSPDGTYSAPIADYLAADPSRLVFTAPPFVDGDADLTITFNQTVDGASVPVTVKEPLGYLNGGLFPCALVAPATVQAPSAGTPAGQIYGGMAARLETGTPAEWTPEGFFVEFALSPPCCSGDDPCPGDLPSCFSVPDPRVSPEAWAFFPAAADPACAVSEGLDACSAGVVQLRGDVNVGLAGRHRAVARYTRDHGLSWDWCALVADGAWAGGANFDLKNSALLWASP